MAVVLQVTLYYRSGWRQAYLHYNADNKGWTNAPGASWQFWDPMGRGVMMLQGHA